MLYRSFATVGGLTMVSRVFGFARDILIASALGSGAIADAFFVAFRFPNLFRRLFAEGAFNSAFVPLFAKRLSAEGQAEATKFANEAMSVLLFTLLGFSAVCMLAMPWLMFILAPGFAADPSKFDLAVLLTQISFPYLLFISLVALLSGVLNSMHRYWVAAAAPILLNAVLMASIILAILLGYSGQPAAGILLSIGVFVAGIVQFIMLWVAVRRAGLRLTIRRPRLTPAVKRLIRLGIPGVISGGITQINIVVGTIIASIQAGAVSYLYYADRLYQLPLGIVGVAIGVVLLPDLSRHLAAGDRRSAMDSQNRSMEFGLLLTLPAAVALAVAAEPIIQVLFERGAFTAADTAATAPALAAFALGLPGFVLIKIFQPAFFARENTVTPMRAAGVNMIVNVLGSLGLFFLFDRLGYYPHVGIALATSIAGWLNALSLWWALRRTGHFETDSRLLRNLPLIGLASAVMGVALWTLIGPLTPHLAVSAPIYLRFAALSALVAAGGIIFFAVVMLTGVLSPAQFASKLRRAP